MLQEVISMTHCIPIMTQARQQPETYEIPQVVPRVLHNTPF